MITIYKLMCHVSSLLYWAARGGISRVISLRVILYDMLPNTEILQGIEDTVDDLEFRHSMITHALLEDMREDLVNTITEYC